MQETVILSIRQRQSPLARLAVALAILLTCALVLGAVLLIAYAGTLKYGVQFPPLDGFWQAALFVNIAVLLIFVSVGVISANHDLAWVHDGARAEIRLEDRYFGRAVFTRRYPVSDVAGIRLWWQPSRGGDPSTTRGPGWWMAALALWNGTEVHLYGLRGGPHDPPTAWQARLERACLISSVMIKREPSPAPPEEPTGKIITRLR